MKLSQLATKLGLHISGKGDPEISGLASIRSARAGDLVFAESAASLADAVTSSASAVVATEAVSEKPVLVSSQPKLAFARAAELINEDKKAAPAIHPTAVVDRSANIAEGVSVGALAYVGRNVTVASGTTIGPGCIVMDGVSIGHDCHLVARVTVYSGTTIGERVTVHAGAVLGGDGFGYVRDAQTGRYIKFPQVGRLQIGDDVEIGANATIDRGALDATTIARGTKIDNLVHIGHNVSIGEDVVIAAQTGVSGSSKLGDGVIVGGQVGIADHVTIESGAILGAQAGIPSNKVIRGKGVVFWGTPARPIKDYLKELAALSRLARGRKKD